MPQRKSSSLDLFLAMLLTLAGGILVMTALVNHWNPNEMNPGVEGMLTAVALCPVFGLLHGLSYVDTVKLSVPVLGIELFVSRAANAPVLAVMGISLLVVGFLGFIASLRAPAEAALTRAPRARRQARREVEASPRLAH